MMIMGKHFHFCDIKRFSFGFCGWLCSREDFLRLPSPPFSATMKCAPLLPISNTLSSVPVLANISDLFA